MTSWLAPIGVLVLGGVISTALGETNARRGVLVCAILIAAAWAICRLADPVKQIVSLGDGHGGEYLTPVLKGLGIAWTAWLFSLALRELGAENAASVAQLVGAAEIAVIASGFVVRLVSTALALV